MPLARILLSAEYLQGLTLDVDAGEGGDALSADARFKGLSNSIC